MRPRHTRWYKTTGRQIWARLTAEVGRKEWHEERVKEIWKDREGQGRKEPDTKGKWPFRQIC